MESNLVSEFMSETQCDVETAYAFLQSSLWDINAALNTWKKLACVDAFQNIGDGSEDVPDNVEPKKLSRGISRATDNVNLVLRARNEFAQEFRNTLCYNVDRYYLDTPEFTFTLPDLTIYGDEFRKFLEKDLIENSTLVSLEQSGRLNWWSENGICQRLWPLATTGDGNCLLHAASLGMWGFHDRLLTLRKALHSFLMTSPYRTAVYRRWRWQQTKINQQSGYVCSESEWVKEWNNIVNMASIEPRRSDGYNSSATYESLEEIHVLVLAHVLRRPIIVVADLMLKDINNEPFAPISFGGIYLPLEYNPKECHRSPLLLTYDMAHFSALVAMEKESLDKTTNIPYAVIPLTDSNGVILPIQFSVDPGPGCIWSDMQQQTFVNNLILNDKDQINLLKDYLDVVDISGSLSPDFDSEDEIDKRFSEIASDGAESDSTIFSNRNRAAKQLQSVAKQFGSIGKSMSKKLKKNFGSISRIAKTKKSDQGKARMLCAEIHTKRHGYQEEMIRNYLQFAQKRFLQEQQKKNADLSPEDLRLQEQAILEGPLRCINGNCSNYGTVLTSYMCSNCFETQKHQEMSKINSGSRFGTGKSKFYRESDMESYDAIKNIPVTKSNSKGDQTLYLSKSTFYNDTGKPFNSLSDPLGIITEADVHHNGSKSPNYGVEQEVSKNSLKKEKKEAQKLSPAGSEDIMDSFNYNYKTDPILQPQLIENNSDAVAYKNTANLEARLDNVYARKQETLPLLMKSCDNSSSVMPHPRYGSDSVGASAYQILPHSQYTDPAEERLQMLKNKKKAKELQKQNSTTIYLPVNEDCNKRYDMSNNQLINMSRVNISLPVVNEPDGNQYFRVSRHVDCEPYQQSSSRDDVDYQMQNAKQSPAKLNYNLSRKYPEDELRNIDNRLCNVSITNINPNASFDANVVHSNQRTTNGQYQQCRSNNCKYYGTVETGYYCSRCVNKKNQLTGIII